MLPRKTVISACFLTFLFTIWASTKFKWAIFSYTIGMFALPAWILFRKFLRPDFSLYDDHDEELTKLQNEKSLIMGETFSPSENNWQQERYMNLMAPQAKLTRLLLTIAYLVVTFFLPAITMAEKIIIVSTSLILINATYFRHLVLAFIPTLLSCLVTPTANRQFILCTIIAAFLLVLIYFARFDRYLMLEKFFPHQIAIMPDLLNQQQIFGVWRKLALFFIILFLAFSYLEDEPKPFPLHLPQFFKQLPVPKFHQQLKNFAGQYNQLSPEQLMAQIQQLQQQMAQLPPSNFTDADQPSGLHDVAVALKNFPPGGPVASEKITAHLQQLQMAINNMDHMHPPSTIAPPGLKPNQRFEKKSNQLPWHKILWIVAVSILGYYLFLLFWKKDKIEHVIHERKINPEGVDEILSLLKTVQGPMFREGVIKTYRLYHQLLEKNYFLPDRAPPPFAVHQQLFGDKEMQQPQLPELCALVGEVFYHQSIIDEKTWKKYTKLLRFALGKLPTT